MQYASDLSYWLAFKSYTNWEDIALSIFLALLVAFVQILVKGQGHDVIYVYKFISTFVKKLVNETVELCE